MTILTRLVRSVRGGRGPLGGVLTFPADPNPYQHLLHEALQGEGVDAAFVPERTASAALNLALLPAELLFARLRGASVLHLHWVFKFVPPWATTVPGGRRAGYLWFRTVLAWARVLRYRVVWTAHNLLPHAQVFPDDTAGRRALVSAADAVIVHGAEVGHRLTDRFGLDPARVTVIPHGPFTPASGAPSRREARAALGVADDDVLVGLVGRIDPYKGADDLLEAAARLEDAGRLPEHLRILVAGSCRQESLVARLTDLARDRDRIVLRPGWLSDEDYAGLTGALDLAVLPFRRVTTSGSAVAALSCGVPVAVPADLLPDLPADAVMRFTDLDDLLTRPDLGSDTHPELTEAARRFATGWTWAEVARATATVYRAGS